MTAEHRVKVGMRVQVYYNIVAGHYSVVALGGPWRNKVVAQMSHVLMENVKFVVQPAGNARVRRERRKNVHAFVRGTITGGLVLAQDAGVGRMLVLGPLEYRTEYPELVRYNPYLHKSFVDRNSEPVFSAKHVALGENEVGRPVMSAAKVFGREGR